MFTKLDNTETNQKFNSLLKYVIIDVVELIMKYTCIKGILNHTKQKYSNCKIIISSVKYNRIIIGYLRDRIEIYDLNMYSHVCPITKIYKLKNIDILQDFRQRPGIQWATRHSTNKWHLNKIFMLHDNIILSLIGWFKPNYKLTNFIIRLTMDDFEPILDNTIPTDKKYQYIMIVYPDSTLDKYYPTINDYYTTSTLDEKFIACVHHDNTIHLYDSNNLNKIYILSNEINIKKLNIKNVDVILKIFYSKQHMLVIYDACICVCKLINNKYVFKLCIPLTKKYLNDILFLSDHEIIIMFRDYTINIYDILNGNIKNFLKLKDISKKSTPKMHVVYGNKPKIIITLPKFVRIYTYDSKSHNKEKYILIKGINIKGIKILSQEQLLFLDSNKGKIINIKNGNIDAILNFDVFKNKINNFPDFVLFPNDIIASLHHDDNWSNAFELWK
jgi:hypothetical protein